MLQFSCKMILLRAALSFLVLKVKVDSAIFKVLAGLLCIEFGTGCLGTSPSVGCGFFGYICSVSLTTIKI